MTSRAFALDPYVPLLCVAVPAAALAQTPPTGGTAYQEPPAPTPTTPVPLPQSVLPRLTVPGAVAQLMPNGLAAAPADAPPQVQNADLGGQRAPGDAVQVRRRARRFIDNGYDCSGTVSWALHFAGVLDSPLDSSSFMRWGEGGPGQWVHRLHEPRPCVRRHRRPASRHERRRRRGQRRQDDSDGDRARPALASDASRHARLPRSSPARLVAQGRKGSETRTGRGVRGRASALPVRWTWTRSCPGGCRARHGRTYVHRDQGEDQPKLLDGPRIPPRRSTTATRSRWSCCRTSRRASPTWSTSKKRLQLQSQKLEQQVVKLDTQARQALPAGKEDLARTALERKTLRADRAAVARPAGRRARGSSRRADRQGAQAAHQDRELPDQEGGHQGPVLRPPRRR